MIAAMTGANAASGMKFGFVSAMRAPSAVAMAIRRRQEVRMVPTSKTLAPAAMAMLSGVTVEPWKSRLGVAATITAIALPSSGGTRSRRRAQASSAMPPA